MVRKSAIDPRTEEYVSHEAVDLASAPEAQALLDWRTKNLIQSYGATIKKSAERYGFDWRLILAIIKQESAFTEGAESGKGASGFMQIMPVTGVEVARLLDLEDISHPRDNIRGGVFYLKRLYTMFDGADEGDKIKLALAAYNAGIARVYNAQEIAAYMYDNPAQWQAVKDALPLLSKRYSTLHENVWHQTKPPAGWFGNSKETIAYVDSVMEYYDEFRLILN